jgi:NADPH-dependent curcumin reductase CurA
MPKKHLQIMLAARPLGTPKPSDFRAVEGPLPVPGKGEMLLRTLVMSLDPYMRGRMNAAKSYAEPVPVGGVMEAGAVSEVVTSDVDGYAPGDTVIGTTGWQSHSLSGGTNVAMTDTGDWPLSTALGALGMPGLTAYAGMTEIGRPKKDETVVVAAASGAVGSVVGQIAKIEGCRAVGIAGGCDKCDFVTGALGFDACVDRRAPDFEAALAAACPAGIDVYFENVGGAVLRAVIPLLNRGARIPVCGTIAHYNDAALPPGPDHLPLLMRNALVKRLTIRGFLVFDFGDRQPEFTAKMKRWLAEGAVKYREDVVEGLENAPQALIGLLRGENFGKVIVRVAEPGHRGRA